MSDNKPGTTDLSKVMHPSSFKELETLGDSIIRDHNQQRENSRHRRMSEIFDTEDDGADV